MEWICVKDRLPEEKINPITQNELKGATNDRSNEP